VDPLVQEVLAERHFLSRVKQTYTAVIDKTPKHALLIQHYTRISLEC